VLAAAGAQVTVVDNSPAQLAQDRLVAEREALPLTIVEGDMRDLSMFDDARFDLIVHPCSNMFVPEVRPVWKEAFRVLRGGGALLSGFYNPAYFIFNPLAEEQGRLEVRHRLPYSDVTSLNDDERKHYTDRGEPLVFGHTLEDLVGGQLAAGFVLTGFYEDYCPEAALSRFMPVLLATRTAKP
jgi:SAM-dependent methyltransferase